MQNFCILAEFSKLLAYWLLKGMQNFCSLSNSSYLCNRRSAVFLGFYRVQNFCILNECSKFLVYFNHWRGCRISASWLQSVNFQSPLTTAGDVWFLHSKKICHCQCSTVFVNYHAFYHVQNFCVLVEFVNFRPFKSIEQDAEFLHPNNLCTRALIVSADFQGSHRVLFFLHLLERSELLLARSTDCQVATVK